MTMKIKQLSLFLENRPGQLTAPCRLLSENGINIRTLSLADTQQFGIMRLILSDWHKGEQILKSNGYVVNITEVVAIEVDDHPGGLAHVLEVFETSTVNIEYMYAFTFGRNGKAVIIFRFDDPDAAIEILQSKGINVVESVEVYNSVED